MKLKLAWDALIIFIIVVLALAFCHRAHADQTNVPSADERKAGRIRAGGSMEAKPAPHYELVLAIYSSARGHAPDLPSYLDVTRISYPTLETCTAAGEEAVRRFQSQRRADALDVDLLDYICLKVTG